MDERRRVLNQLRPPDEWPDIARRVPSPTIPPARSRLRGMVAAALTLAVAGALIAYAVIALTPSHRAIPTHPSPTPTPTPSVTKLGNDGTMLWPERTRAAVLAAQTRADAGKGTNRSSPAGGFWQTDPSEVVSRFAVGVLGWSGVESAAFDSGPFNPGGETTAYIHSTVSRCKNPPPPNNAPSAGCYAREATITLTQPVRRGDRGIWVLTSASSTSESIDLQPGQVVQNGSVITVHADIAPAFHSVWGFSVGTYGTGCLVTRGHAVSAGSVQIRIQVPPDSVAGTSCGPTVTG